MKPIPKSARFTIFGSSCAADILGRKPGDLDLLVWDARAIPGSLGTRQRGMVEYFAFPQHLATQFGDRATPEQLLTIKESHFPWLSKNGAVHAKDIEKLRAHGILPDEALKQELRTFWEKHFPAKRAVLKDQKKAEFFNKQVIRDIDHDTLHDLLALHGTPLFRGLLREGQEVWMSKDKFFQQTEEHQVDTAREEAIVLTMERSRPSEHAYPGTYRKVCYDLMTRMSKGWFSYFIADHWTLVSTPPLTHADTTERIHHHTYPVQ